MMEEVMKSHKEEVLRYRDYLRQHGYDCALLVCIKHVLLEDTEYTDFREFHKDLYRIYIEMIQERTTSV